ncbi:MAG: hypothetical protein UU13_C0026G0002 [Candidatus Nomurabacteria bacterium GW2011_GWB1_40_7]|uniref:Uncharacterized protein n=1 Tax=Candidatus Nomurabacteria bacterium GW2011_GWB1_40_7 TaxID=1618744 RepID=A0A0G0T4J6_9BACT|nr:MAG: hypothetical protein UU13_C0026G0002 [Candidatus Nomurabacteria bacterium GW2011_GWB1_40_7]
MISKKNTFYAMVIIFFCILGFFLYLNIRKNKIEIENSISHLDTTYIENTNNKKNYKIKSYYYDSGLSVEGGIISAYLDDNSIKIIEGGYSGETFLQDYDFYFESKSSFLLKDIFQQFDRPYSEKGRIQIKKETNKYYFINLKMVRWTDTQGQTVDYYSYKFKKKEQEILNQLDNILNVINTEKPIR